MIESQSVLFNDMAPVPALKASFAANMKNWLVMMVFGLIVLVLSFFAALPMGLGFLSRKGLKRFLPRVHQAQITLAAQ